MRVIARSPRVDCASYQPWFQAASAVSAAFTPSRKTLLCGDVRSDAQNGMIFGTISGYETAHWPASVAQHPWGRRRVAVRHGSPALHAHHIRLVRALLLAV